MKPLVLAGLALLMLGTGCDSTTEPSEYTNAVFTLEDAVLPAGSGVTALTPSAIRFEPDGSIVINSCNRCEGRYTWESNELHVRDLTCTVIGCGPNLDLGEWLYADRIVVSDTDDDEVTLVAEQDGEIATFLFSVAER